METIVNFVKNISIIEILYFIIVPAVVFMLVLVLMKIFKDTNNISRTIINNNDNNDDYNSKYGDPDYIRDKILNIGYKNYVGYGTRAPKSVVDYMIKVEERIFIPLLIDIENSKKNSARKKIELLQDVVNVARATENGFVLKHANIMLEIAKDQYRKKFNEII